MAGTGPLSVRLPDAGTSNITPTYAVPDTSRLYEQMGDAAARLGGVVDDAIARRSARAGAKAGQEAAAQTSMVVDAGETPAARPKAGHAIENILTHGAYEAAFNQAAFSRLKNDVDNYDERLRGQFRYDSEGYKAASGRALSGFIQGAPEEMAVDLENYGTTKFNDGYATVSRVAEERARQEAAQSIGVRVKGLDDKLLGLAASGSLDSVDFERADAERSMLQLERAKNPAILYSPAQAAQDDSALYDALHGAAAAHTAVTAYGEAGGGLPGRAAAFRVLDDEVLKGETFKDLSPDRLHRIYLDAKKQISDYSAADVEQRREEEAQAREQRAEQRERVGSLRLGIMLGEVTEGSIKARDDISEGDKASLIAGARAQARRDRSEARSAAALERAGVAANYREFSDAAAAGTLSEGDIADALHSGMITPGKAQTLRAKRDKAVAPVVDDIMAPVKDTGNRPGRKASNEKLAIAEEQATAWARQNPNAPLADRLKQGHAIAERVFGAPKASPAPGANPQAARAGKINRLKAQRRSGEISQGEYITKMNEVLDAR